MIVDEKEQTLNQLLAELDGFDTSSGLVLLAATSSVGDRAMRRAMGCTVAAPAAPRRSRGHTRQPAHPPARHLQECPLYRRAARNSGGERLEVTQCSLRVDIAKRGKSLFSSGHA